jgi:hypothetical protein
MTITLANKNGHVIRRWEREGKGSVTLRPCPTCQVIVEWEDGLPTWRHMLKGCFGRGKPSATYWG